MIYLYYPIMMRKRVNFIMEKTFKIVDEDGIHARPATALVTAANKFASTESFAEAKGKKVTLKSILGVLSLGLEQGDVIVLSTQGAEEDAALKALTDVMVNEGLGEING